MDPLLRTKLKRDFWIGEVMKLDGEAPVGFSGEVSSLPTLVRWDRGNININVIENIVVGARA